MIIYKHLCRWITDNKSSLMTNHQWYTYVMSARNNFRLHKRLIVFSILNAFSISQAKFFFSQSGEREKMRQRRRGKNDNDVGKKMTTATTKKKQLWEEEDVNDGKITMTTGRWQRPDEKEMTTTMTGRRQRQRRKEGDNNNDRKMTITTTGR